MLFGLLRGVGVVDVSLVATGNLSVCRHIVGYESCWLVLGDLEDYLKCKKLMS